jgi:hypothetical protein
MSKETSVIVLGLWVLIMPYLGIYRSWLSVLMVLTGLGLMALGFLLRGEALARGPQEGARASEDSSFVENQPHEHHQGLHSLN